jgi:acylphosphatase
MGDLASVKILVFGRVQGVFFRAFTSEQAVALGLKGYVRNLTQEGTVEVVAEGERARLESLIAHLKTGPPSARVEQVVTSWSDYSGSYDRFRIRY